MCHGTFTKDWTDEEAKRESDILWPATPMEEMEVVCPDCFEKIKPNNLVEQALTTKV